MIGADELSDMAKEAEDAAKNSDGGYIGEHDGELTLKYSQTVQVISEALHLDAAGDAAEDAGENVGEDTSAGSDASAELTKDDFWESLLELKGCLETFEEDKAERLLAEIKDAVYDGRPVETILCEIIQDVENFDLSAASDKTEALIHALEGGDAE